MSDKKKFDLIKGGKTEEIQECDCDTREFTLDDVVNEVVEECLNLLDQELLDIEDVLKIAFRAGYDDGYMNGVEDSRNLLNAYLTDLIEMPSSDGDMN